MARPILQYHKYLLLYPMTEHSTHLDNLLRPALEQILSPSAMYGRHLQSFGIIVEEATPLPSIPHLFIPFPFSVASFFRSHLPHLPMLLQRISPLLLTDHPHINTSLTTFCIIVPLSFFPQSFQYFLSNLYLFKSVLNLKFLSAQCIFCLGLPLKDMLSSQISFHYSTGVDSQT
ncbi:hypothetical protein CPB84DRAFT_1383500 [Gymnopilus junonius]|uniref:Uncharacterized protein n=1 Tax=Gymnopilus junonius TaxID=109634 RepID=A0A9P5NLI5_GYMJU|nr:hypothetical protein CPB84DRAFT_1383500 [Gymnopilus junonius]